MGRKRVGGVLFQGFKRGEHRKSLEKKIEDATKQRIILKYISEGDKKKK